MKPIVLAALLAATGELALAATQPGGEASVTLGGKPEYYTGEGDGQYVLVSGKAFVTVDKTWSLALTESLVSVSHPEKKSELTDPLLSASYKLGAVSFALTATPGLSLASRDADHLGTLKPSVTYSRQVGAFSGGVGTALAQRFFRYTLNADGAPNPRATTSLFAFGGVDLGASVNLSVNFARLRTQYYAGPAKYNYSNGASLAWQMTDAASLEAGVTTSDTQLRPDGTDNNEFTLYKRNETEIYVSAAYAL